MNETDCQVIELRRYTLHPGTRDVLIELFEREFIETQEAVGLHVLGQFRLPDQPDHYAWLRGFADMASRPAGLQAFYGGPVWAAHRDAANATMIDSDDVLLLKPAWPGSGVPTASRAARGSTAPAPGMVEVAIFHLREGASDALVAHCRDVLLPLAREAGARKQGWYVTEPAANNFPRLPIREGEFVVMAVLVFDDEAAEARFSAGGAFERALASFADVPGRPIERLRMTPTARSGIHA
jgi:hypothetical protein